MNNYHFPKTSAFEEVKGINQTSPSASFVTERWLHFVLNTFWAPKSMPEKECRSSVIMAFVPYTFPYSPFEDAALGATREWGSNYF